jgi:hypothetical protein
MGEYALMAFSSDTIVSLSLIHMLILNILSNGVSANKEKFFSFTNIYRVQEMLAGETDEGRHGKIFVENIKAHAMHGRFHFAIDFFFLLEKF